MVDLDAELRIGQVARFEDHPEYPENKQKTATDLVKEGVTSAIGYSMKEKVHWRLRT
jgi:hypothetical protein